MTTTLLETAASSSPPHAPAGEVMIRIQSITKRFPARKTWSETLRNPFSREMMTVLNDVSFQVARGEFFGLLGQNGAGKTTLFRILSTLVLPDAGRASIGGLDSSRDAAAVRALVSPVVASERSLYWRLTARENLRLFAVLQGVRRGEVDHAVNSALRVVALADTGTKLVGTFSSGMRQRLLIARSLLGNPRVLLLDEPTRSLDPISARDFRNFLRDVIVGEQGCTVLLATHDAEDVWNLCERVAVLHRGELLAVDRTETLRQRAGGVLYRIWSRDETLDLQDVIARRCGARAVDRENAAEQGWTVSTLEMDAGSGSEESAQLLRRLVAEGVVIARYERRSPDLADLLERVVAARVEPHA